MDVTFPPAGIGTEQLLFKLLTANMNSTADQALTRQFQFTNFLITSIRVNNASISLTTAAGGFYTAASKGGVTAVAAAQTYAALTGATLGMEAAIAAAGMATLTTGALFLSLTTAQGSAATADIYVRGVPLT
jgi:hypothetical protein